MKSKYTAARTIISFIGMLGWVGLAVGAIAAIMGITLNSMAGPMLLGTGLMTSISSLILVAISSVAVAVLDTGDEARQTNTYLRAIAEKQGIDVTTIAPAEPEEKQGSTADTQKDKSLPYGKTLTYDLKGEKIVKSGDTFYWAGQSYPTLAEAKSAIEAASKSKKLQKA